MPEGNGGEKNARCDGDEGVEDEGGSDNEDDDEVKMLSWEIYK